MDLTAAWTVDVDTWRPFHPLRLISHLEAIGGSADLACTWGDAAPHTRVVITGVGDGICEVVEALESALMTDSELARESDGT